ncbi:AraC family transcriptional regulator [Ferrimonas marina]|uniref:Transcriptional regulator, AraC family n=1 Tax=Ferrimonas marina TaxID=299255 RepID=A0A1M5MQ10_9GAMM|nr:AraC family transcriptional regulator [Ferrimonas marina]SHG79484.1 transcriptional regulator, AraC family [Ferrimonas marina]
MSAIQDQFQSLCQTLGHEAREGFLPTYSDHIVLFHTHTYCEKSPILYEPGLFIMVSGSKVGYINDLEIRYGVGRYLMTTSAYMMDCETQASAEQPVSGLYIQLQTDLIYRLVEQMGEASLAEPASTAALGICEIESTPRLDTWLLRTLQALHDETETRLLMDGIMEELYLLLLRSPHGPLLRRYVRRESTDVKLVRAINHINEYYGTAMTVEQLAELSGMSVSSFHRAFKDKTTDSPMQYIKKIRLHKAKVFIVKDKLSVNQAAMKVGYRSVFQFSREFKRFYGLPPSQADQLSYRAFTQSLAN